MPVTDDVSPPEVWKKIIVAGLTLVYIIAFRPVIAFTGPLGAALIGIPVAGAGWYFGISAGVVASIFGIALSSFLLTLTEGQAWPTWVILYWPSNLLLVAVGYLAGRLREAANDHNRLTAELHSREKFLNQLNQTTRSNLDPKDSTQAYDFLNRHLLSMFAADHGFMVGWDEGQQRASMIASTLSVKASPSRLELNLRANSVLAQVLQSRLVLSFEDLSSLGFELGIPLPVSRVPAMQSVLGIPLRVREMILGVALLGYDRPHPFSPQEKRYAGLAGDQVGLALWSVQRELEIQRRLTESNVLANIERALSETERVGVETVLQLIVDSAKAVIVNAKQVILHLLDNEKQILVPRAVAGFSDVATGKLNMRLGEGVAGQVIASGEAIAVPDVQKDPRFLNRMDMARFRSLIVVPIQSNERRVGTISVQSDQPEAFSTEEILLLSALGTQAAIALENANLMETTRESLEESHALYRINQSLAASLEPDQLMKDVVELLQEKFGYSHVHIYMADPQSGDFILRAGTGEIGSRLKREHHHLARGSSIVGHTAELGDPFMTDDVDQVIFFDRNPLMPETRSELTIPIKIGRKVVGVLDIQHSEAGHLSERHLKLMSAVADQLAVALQKANLYAELQESLRQEKQTRSNLVQSERLAVVGRLLASVSHELNNPLQAIQNALFLLKDERNLSEQGRQDLEIVLSETERLATLLGRLRTTYRPTRTEEVQDLQLNTIIEDVYALTATHLRHKEINFEFQLDPDLQAIPGIPDRIVQVVLNLFMNAVEAMPSGGQMTVCTRNLADEDRILLSVKDSGPGIDPQILPHIFEPFVSDKENGTGLGLTITYDIIRQHNGEIHAGDDPAGGAVFKVWLPVHPQVQE